MSSAIALFNLPISGEKDGMPVLIMGMDELGIIVVNDDGELKRVGMLEVKTNWRYDWRAHKWFEVGDLSGSTEDDAPDGGEDLSGSVPEPD